MISGRITVKARPNMSREVIQKLDNGLDDFADLILTKSQEFVPVDTAMLKKSGHVESEWLVKRVQYDSPYALYVEYGTDPHMPPVEPLIGWAHRVLGLSQKEAEAAAWRIARKIAREGTEAQPFLKPAVDFSIPKAAEIFRRVME